MEQNIKMLFQSFMRYGAYFGLLQVFGAILFYLTVNPETIGFLHLALTYLVFASFPWIGGLIFLTNSYKKNELGGFISMPEILQFSAFIGLFGGVFIVLFGLIFNKYIDSHFLSNIINTLSVKLVAIMEASKSSQAEIDNLILQLNTYKELVEKGVSVTEAFVSALQYSFNALITMVIFGWFLRKPRPLFPEKSGAEIDSPTL